MSDTEKPSWEWQQEVEALRQQLAQVTADKQYHMDCINLLAKHIGRLGDTSNTVINAAIQQLAQQDAEIGRLTAAPSVSPGTP